MAENLRSRLIISAFVAPISGVVSYIFEKTLESWGILDPLATRLGKLLKDSFTPAQVGCAISALIFVLLYGLALLFIWRKVAHSVAVTRVGQAIAEIDREDVMAGSLSITQSHSGAGNNIVADSIKIGGRSDG
jgi:hypothetical protein